jgi:SAM-dependent methyltransferase
VTGLDLTPELLERARENARIANVDIQWHQGDVEQLPFPDRTFDMVLSQFGHIFAPRPEVAIGEMLRVLRAGGTIAFSTWPPELCIGRLFALTSRYLPPPPPGVVPPHLWGDPNVVRERLGAAVKDLRFDRALMRVPALSLQHHRAATEKTAGPILKLVESLSATDPGRLETYRREFEATVADYFEGNIVRNDFLITRATKVLIRKPATGNGIAAATGGGRTAREYRVVPAKVLQSELEKAINASVAEGWEFVSASPLGNDWGFAVLSRQKK